MTARTTLLHLLLLTQISHSWSVVAWQHRISADDLVVIVNPNVAAPVLEADIQRIYLNRQKRWPDDKDIVFTTLADGPVHQLFLNRFLGKSAAQFTTYWKRVIFTGKGAPPKSFQTEEEVVAYVAQTPGAIGYVSGKAVLSGVVVVPLD